MNATASHATALVACLAFLAGSAQIGWSQILPEDLWVTNGAAPDVSGVNNPRIIPPDAKFRGKSYGEWQAAWQQWVLSQPADADHPFFPGGNVLQGQTGNVWFLTGVFAPPQEVRSITIPVGTALFVAIVNAECSTAEGDPFHGDDEAELRACAQGWVDFTANVEAELDGVALQNMSAYRHQSPLFTWGPLPDPNVLGLPEGTEAESVDDGFYLLVAPLSVGQHTIEFSGDFVGTPFGDFTIDTRYNITVVPPSMTPSPVVARSLEHTSWGMIKASYR